LSREFCLHLGDEIDCAAHPDIVEMHIEEPTCRELSAAAWPLEEVVVSTRPARSVQFIGGAIEGDPVHIDTPIFAGSDAAN